MGKVFIGLFFETVVVTHAATRSDATKVLRKALAPRHRKEAASISLMNHLALVYWSETRRSFWYRLPSTTEACGIHPDRVPTKLHPLIPMKEPDQPGWDAKTSAANPPKT